MTTDSKKTQTVTDYHGTSYSLVKKIGEGGQGMVLTTNHPNLVVKVSNAYTSEMQLKDDLAQIQTVMRLPLRDLKIALPLSLLKFKTVWAM